MKEIEEGVEGGERLRLEWWMEEGEWGKERRSKKMGDAHHQLQALNDRHCAKCFSRRCTCGLIIFLTIGHPGLPPQVSVSHHQNPCVPRTQSCRQIQTNRHHLGGRAAGPAVLPGGKTRRWCWSLSPLLSPADPCKAHTSARCLCSWRGSL